MPRKGRLVKGQKIGDSYGSAHASEGSAYWAHVERFGRRTEEGTVIENKFANPDTLAYDNTNTIWGTGSKPELAELLLERFADEHGNFPILSKMENKVLNAYVKHGQAMLVCASLKISRSSYNTYMARIQKKFKRLLPILNF